MKKTYMTPEAEKIAFNYRDQVVAASSTDAPVTTVSNGYDVSTCNAIDQIIDFLFDFGGSSLCA